MLNFKNKSDNEFYTVIFTNNKRYKKIKMYNKSILCNNKKEKKGKFSLF